MSSSPLLERSTPSTVRQMFISITRKGTPTAVAVAVTVLDCICMASKILKLSCLTLSHMTFVTLKHKLEIIRQTLLT